MRIIMHRSKDGSHEKLRNAESYVHMYIPTELYMCTLVFALMSCVGPVRILVPGSG